MSRPYAPRNRFQGPSYRLNGRIRAREVRVIGPDNQQIGIHPLGDALRMARNLGLDLVEIAPTATPPVCRIVDYGKFRYEESKREKTSATANRSQLKEVQLRPGIEAHDYATKLKHAREFLENGAQLKLAMRFRGRELRHPELGIQLMQKFAADLADCGRTDSPPKRMGRNVNLMLRPLSRQQREKLGAAQPGPRPDPGSESMAPDNLS